MDVQTHKELFLNLFEGSKKVMTEHCDRAHEALENGFTVFDKNSEKLDQCRITGKVISVGDLEDGNIQIVAMAEMTSAGEDAATATAPVAGFISARASCMLDDSDIVHILNPQTDVTFIEKYLVTVVTLPETYSDNLVIDFHSVVEDVQAYSIPVNYAAYDRAKVDFNIVAPVKSGVSTDPSPEEKNKYITTYTYGPRTASDYSPTKAEGQWVLILPTVGDITVNLSDKKEVTDISDCELKLTGLDDQKNKSKKNTLIHQGVKLPEVDKKDKNKITWNIQRDWKIPASTLQSLMPTVNRMKAHYYFYFSYTINGKAPKKIMITSDENAKVATTLHKVLPVIVINDCLAGGAMIRMKDGSQKAIEAIKTGDEVLLADQKNSAKVASIATGSRYEGLRHITLKDGKNIRVTGGHMLQREDDSMITAIYVKEGDKLKTVTGPVEVEKSEPICLLEEEEIPIYSLALEGGGNYFIVNDFIVGDEIAQLNENNKVIDPKNFIEKSWLSTYKYFAAKARLLK